MAAGVLVAAQILLSLGLLPGIAGRAQVSLAEEPDAPPQDKMPRPPRPTPPTLTVTVTVIATDPATPPHRTPPPAATPPPTQAATPPPTPSPTPIAAATVRPSAAPTVTAAFVIAAPPGAPLAMLAPLCGDGGQSITWSWTAAADAGGYQLQISTTGAQLPDGTLRQADTFNGQLDAGSATYTITATPGQPYFAVVSPLTATGGADTMRTSRLTEAVCVDPGAGSRPLPPPPDSSSANSRETAAAPPQEPPAAPGDLTATPLDGSEVRLDWASNSSDEDGFAVDDGYRVVAQVPAGVTTITLVGLDPDGPYCAAVYAYNQAGASDLSNYVCFTTLQPSDDSSDSARVGGLKAADQIAARYKNTDGRGHA